MTFAIFRLFVQKHTIKNTDKFLNIPDKAINLEGQKVLDFRWKNGMYSGKMIKEELRHQKQSIKYPLINPEKYYHTFSHTQQFQ